MIAAELPPLVIFAALVVAVIAVLGLVRAVRRAGLWACCAFDWLRGRPGDEL